VVEKAANPRRVVAAGFKLLSHFVPSVAMTLEALDGRDDALTDSLHFSHDRTSLGMRNEEQNTGNARISMQFRQRTLMSLLVLRNLRIKSLRIWCFGFNGLRLPYTVLPRTSETAPCRTLACRRI
jgi:hypothetical protein